jgi:hypothetical protein
MPDQTNGEPTDDIKETVPVTMPTNTTSDEYAFLERIGSLSSVRVAALHFTALIRHLGMLLCVGAVLPIEARERRSCWF